VVTLRQLLEEMSQRRASDLHLTAGVPPEFRVDGILVPAESEVLTPEMTAQLAYSVMSDEQRKRFETTRELDFSFGIKNLARFRANVFLQRGVVSMAIRQIPFEILQMEKLGLPPVVKEFTNRQRGLVLITGPTGSGKTSTLYAALGELVETGKNITTIENPVEYELPGTNQGQINEKAGFTFAKGLRAVLRQDPDVIMVGEIRDSETLTTAIEASLTGHLVFSTLHTNSAIGTITRLLDMGTEPYFLASAVQAIIAQRLVRRICSHCQTELAVPSGVRQLFGDDVPDSLRRGAGCAECRGTGFSGRIGIYEMVRMTSEVKELVLARASEPTLLAGARRSHGMSTLREQCLARVREGLTTLEEVVRVTQS